MEYGFESQHKKINREIYTYMCIYFTFCGKLQSCWTILVRNPAVHRYRCTYLVHMYVYLSTKTTLLYPYTYIHIFDYYRLFRLFLTIKSKNQTNGPELDGNCFCPVNSRYYYLCLWFTCALQTSHLELHKHPRTDGGAHATTQLPYSLLLPHP